MIKEHDSTMTLCSCFIVHRMCLVPFQKLLQNLMNSKWIMTCMSVTCYIKPWRNSTSTGQEIIHNFWFISVFQCIAFSLFSFFLMTKQAAFIRGKFSLLFLFCFQSLYYYVFWIFVSYDAISWSTRCNSSSHERALVHWAFKPNSV